MKSFFVYLTVFGLGGLLVSCLQLEYDNVEGTTPYAPLIALPITKTSLYYEDTSALSPDIPPSVTPFTIEHIDTIDVDMMNTFFNNSNVLALTIHSNITNKFPFDIAIDFSFRTESGETVPLTNDPISLDGTVDNYGIIVDSTTIIHDIEVASTSIIPLLQTTQVYVETTVYNVVLSTEVIEQISQYSVNTDIGFLMHIKSDSDE